MGCKTEGHTQTNKADQPTNQQITDTDKSMVVTRGEEGAGKV